MDRRDFLKTSAAAGVAHTFVSAKAASPRQSDLIKLENAKQGTTAWQLFDRRLLLEAIGEGW